MKPQPTLFLPGVRCRKHDLPGADEEHCDAPPVEPPRGAHTWLLHAARLAALLVVQIRRATICKRRAAKPGRGEAVDGVDRTMIIVAAEDYLVRLPECVHAHVMKYSGTAGASALSLTCSKLYQSTWESVDVWQAFLGCTALMSATALRDEHRWASYGIDTLCGWRKRPPAAGHAAALKGALRAIHGLIPEDAPRRIEIVVSSLADLLRWYDSTDNAAHKSARELVKAVSTRPEVFSADHVQELQRALDDSRVLRKTLRVPIGRAQDRSPDPGPFAILFEDDAFAGAESGSSDGELSPVCISRCHDLTASPDECVMDRVLTALRAVPTPDGSPCNGEDGAVSSLWLSDSPLLPSFPALATA